MNMDKIKLLWSKTNRWHIGLIIFLIIELKILPSGQVGFKCNDPALSHLYTGDTITLKQLFVAILIMPLAVLLLIERLYHSDSKTKPKQRALKWYKEYLFGVLVNLVIVQGIKLIVGSPRPHFFDTCSPEEAATCEGSEYVSWYTCTKAHWLSQSDRSFPSGHTSLAVHAGVFLCYYLRIRGRGATCRVCECIALLLAACCGVSRVWDRRHHWWDVAAGAALAAPILIYTIVYLCKNFETSKGDKQIEACDNESYSNSNKVINNVKNVDENQTLCSLK